MLQFNGEKEIEKRRDNLLVGDLAIV